MTWEIFQSTVGVFMAIIGSVGGAGALMYVISSRLGEFWAKKHLESIKKEYQKEIEFFKTQLELIRCDASRYSERQFELYTKLWHSLYDLKKRADLLWEEANEKNLKNFSEQLNKTIDEVERSYLFIREDHYNELKRLLSEFSNYEMRKTKLVQIYRKKGFQVDDLEIRQLIDRNRISKQRYDELIHTIRRDLKEQIMGRRLWGS